MHLNSKHYKDNMREIKDSTKHHKTFSDNRLEEQPMVLRFGMKHQALQLYKCCINHDPGMTVIYFKARST